MAAAEYSHAQTAFPRTGQVFSILGNTNELQLFTVGTGNSIITYPFGALPAGGIDCLGFCRSDNFLYGINISNNHLFRIGQNGISQDLGAINLNPALFYMAGDVSPDGKYLVAIGSDVAGNDVSLVKIDLSAPGFPTQTVPMSGVGHLTDINFEPATGKVYGFDQMQSAVVTLDISTGAKTAFPPVESGNNFYGMYFDAFGDLYAIGSTLYGIVDGYFRVDKNTGKEHRITTGPPTIVSDIASCPFSVEMKCVTDPAAALPCSDIDFEYQLVNSSGETMQDVEFLHALPAGFHFTGVLSNTFGGLVDTMTIPGSMLIQHIQLTPGQRSLRVQMHVDDLPKGGYNSQPLLRNLPALYDFTSKSDYITSPGFEDSTIFRVTRYDKDTLSFRWFICHGEMITLDAAEFGSHINWNTGAVTQALMVDTGGIYNFKAGTTCEQVFVSHEVTSATCPYTIAIDHVFLPDTSFACSDVIFRFLLRNDSGEPRYHVSFQDTLPPGFTFSGIVSGPVGATALQDSGAAIITINEITLPVGTDTLDIRVHAGNIVPGRYKSRAVLHDLPLLMGPIRLSDNPLTFLFDSSELVIQGALSDSVFLDTVVCRNTPVILDARSLGKSFEWDDGSILPERAVQTPGTYHLTVFDGCEPANVFWEVAPAPVFDLIPPPDAAIHQGETLELTTQVLNGSDSIYLSWTDPLPGSLSCTDCASPQAMPLATANYILIGSNEVCRDTIQVLVKVDDSRRIYAPNIFSPDGDGLNDYFYLQSPDYGLINHIGIYDRWGNLCFEQKNTLINDKETFWDGTFRGKNVTAGVYTWLAKITFVDGKTGYYTGDITVIR